MKKLLLARHGNNFEPSAVPYIVGRNEDLKLTQEGEAQATRLAELLGAQDLIPSAVYCGGLQRTKTMAQIVCSALSLPAPIVDARLTELDYGAWSGLTTEEVRARFGDAEIDAWDNDGIMPTGRGWQPERDSLLANVRGFAQDATQDEEITLGITSNGVLRFFATLVDGLFEQLAASRQLKVGTGNLCCLEFRGSTWQLGFWNRKP